MTEATIETFDAVLPHGITLACRASGPADAPLVLLLHGFPEGAFVWDATIRRLAARARCVAPDLRGFGRSSAPHEVQAYRARHLVQDIDAVIAAQGGRAAVMVAHDWGGAVAWALAAQRPERLARLVILNSPHPATFLRELRRNPAQRAASAYMNFLCRDDAAALLAADDFARLWPFFADREGAAPAWLDEPMRERYRAHWRGGLQGGLNYYRASPLRPDNRADAPLHSLTLPREATEVRVPTTALWGEADRALLPALLDGLDAHVPDLRIERLPEASHWIVHEAPARVAQTIEREVERATAAR